MAKAKKAKNEERDNSNSEAVVKHQKLCLSIDMENHLIYGYTELQIVVPDNGVVGLHVDNLAIEKVIVDGEPAEFEVFPHYQHLDPKDRWCAVSSSTSAADASGSVYLSSLELELLPNLLIMCSRTAKADTKEQEHPEVENGGQLSADASRLSWVQNLKLVRIDYWVEKADSGIHFNENVLHTNNQLRRARCWFPCMDDSLQCCCYDLEFTVPSNFVAVSSGTLLHQVLTKDDPLRKTFIYKLDVPVAAQWISLAVARFEILSDRHSPLLSHFCLPDDLSKLRNTVIFFHNAFSHYEDYLSASFPFGSYTQVFIAPEMAISSCSLGASTSIFSSHLLFDERIIDQTIHTRIKLAYALARQWFGVYITPEAPNDEWLLDGLAGFLADSFIKRFLGNNEARYRRYKANCAVCQADDSGATSLNSALASKDLYGTQSFGFYGKIRSWKSVAVLQMLEKQMGPESFRKILQHIIIRARDANRLLRTLSTKEFRHLANKIGNLERPFLKEFFPRWVGSCGCPVLKMGFSYNKRKNMIELAVLRGCTSRPDLLAGANKVNPDSDNRETDVGWPGMMSIRIHELDGMYDHPILPMAGEPWQLMEIQCHSKLAAKRFLKPKKGSKHDGSDDNGDGATTTDLRLNSDSPILWLRADPEMEYLAEVHFNQPVQMWINQLEKDKDVVAQAHAITVLEELRQLSFPVINTLNNFLNDSKAFWRVRIQAAYALATTASEDTDWAGLHYLINFYKSRRFDPNIGLPRPNDFHDFQEYFVLETVPHAIALVRSSDKKSPREAVEFILQLLKYNDNNGNGFSDVFWLAALVHAVGELEFGQQSIVCLPSLLKRLDRLLQFDRFMPSHNGILTISCLQSLTQMALKLSEFIPLDHVIELIKPYQLSKTWQIQVEAGRALLELEFQCKGIDAALTLFIRYLKDEISLRGQTKLGVCALRLAQMAGQSDCDNIVKGDTLVALLRLLESPLSFNNVILRHYIFCILQVLAGRAPTLYGIPKDETLRMGHSKTCSELKNIFAALIKQSKPPEPSSYPSEIPHDLSVPDSFVQTDALPENLEMVVSGISRAPDTSLVPITQNTGDASKDGTYQRNLMSVVTEPPAIIPNVSSIIDDRGHGHGHIDQATHPLAETSVDINVEASRGEQIQVSIRPEMEPAVHIGHDSMIEQPPKETVIGPEIQERIKKPKLKIKVKHSAASSKAVNPDNARNLKTQQGQNDAERGASSSVSVDAPQRNLAETVSTGGQNVEDANSCHDVGSRVTASIGSAKPSEELVKELQCTADSSKVSLPLPPDNNHLHAEPVKIDQEPQCSEHIYVSPVGPSRHDAAGSSVPRSEEKEKKKDKDKKRKKNNHNDDPERSEKKRQKKEKKRKEKEMAKLLSDKSKTLPSVELGSQGKRLASVEREAKPTSVVSVGKGHQPETRQGIVQGEGAVSSADELRRRQYPETSSGSLQQKPAELSESNAAVVKRVDEGANAPQIQGAGTPKIRIRFKKRTLGEK